jgi:hypothetical protein
MVQIQDLFDFSPSFLPFGKMADNWETLMNIASRNWRAAVPARATLADDFPRTIEKSI